MIGYVCKVVGKNKLKNIGKVHVDRGAGEADIKLYSDDE